MDIDAALERLRQLAASDPDSEFAIAFEALDGWLSHGGFFPAAWRHPDPRLNRGVQIGNNNVQSNTF